MEIERTTEVHGGHESFPGTSSVMSSSVLQRRRTEREPLPLLVRAFALSKEATGRGKSASAMAFFRRQD